MSERTTIGGTVYEAIGSSSSNLLLRCNGTARVLWGGKLIDLIKNGKIASSDSKELIFIVSDESEIKSDGVYVLTTKESDQLWVCKDGNKYNFTEENLYISASKKLNFTAELKKLALENIGLFYNTLEELVNAKILNGIAYVVENNKLYTIKNGIIEEFEAQLKSIAVDEETDGVKVINSSVKIILSILDEEYLVLADKRITAYYSIHVKNSAQLGSESADKTKGYRLYIDGDTSYLDVDEINVRNGIKIDMYKKIDFSNFDTLITSEKLEPHTWYLITDFQNHWKLPIYNTIFNRPILVRALTNKTLYETGYLFRDHRIKIHYDPSYKEIIILKKEIEGEMVEEEIITRGRITWMLDSNNNLANFDFLDYTDSENNELATLHYPNDNKEQDKSIFPRYSHDNKLIVYDLKGTVLKDKKIDNTNVTVVDFQFVDFNEIETETTSMQMYNNDIECRGLILTYTCNNFYNNILHEAANVEISNDFYNNEFLTIYNSLDIIFSEVTDNSIFNKISFSFKTERIKCKSAKCCLFLNELINCSFKTISDVNFNLPFTNVTINEINEGVYFTGNINNTYINKIISSGENVSVNSISNCTIEVIENSTIYNTISNSIFNNIVNCLFNAVIDNVVFKDLHSVNFDVGTVNNSKSFYDLNNVNFNLTDYTLLYNTDKRKEIYIHYGIIQVICIPDVIFYRGMIIMHSGSEPIPEGWAPCDGGTYTFEGVSSTTPKLTDRFIKAVTSVEAVGETKNPELNDNNELLLKKKHIPKHKHEIDINKLPEYTSDEISGYTSRYDPQSMLVTTTTGTLSVSVSVCVGVSVGESSDSDCDSSSDSITLYGSTLRYLGQGNSYETIKHKHKMDWGTENILTEEQDKDIELESFKLEPHYYSLIFIMKL